MVARRLSILSSIPLPLVILALRARSSFSRSCRGFFVARIPRDLWRTGLWDPWVDREGCKIIGDSLICCCIYFPYIYILLNYEFFSSSFFFILNEKTLNDKLWMIYLFKSRMIKEIFFIFRFEVYGQEDTIEYPFSCSTNLQRLWKCPFV